MTVHEQARTAAAAPLIGREREQRELRRLLSDARLGRSAVMALVGEAGIGKTALLTAAVELARPGMRVLHARGVESERDVPFAGLLELLRPALGSLSRIPAPQAAALEAALALRPARPADRFAVGAATLSLLAAHADEASLLVVVDDAHWLDPGSADALRFATRRLVADPIAVLLAVREGHGSLLDSSDLPITRLEGLTQTATFELLSRATGTGMRREIAERMFSATAGNPLALLEVASTPQLFAVELPGTPVPVGQRIRDAFLGRVTALPPATRRALVLAAAADGGELATIERAARRVGADAADLDAAEAAGLIALADGRVEFRHPLARAAVYARAGARERRAAHRALADALPDRDADRRAWHLAAAAAAGPDETASEALAQAGQRAHGRSAYGVAAAAFERAARLSPDPVRSDRLLHNAADAARLAGAPDHALELTEEIRARSPELDLAIANERLRGDLITRRGPVMDGHAVLVAGADMAAAAGRHEMAALMLAEAAAACFYAGAAAAMTGAAQQALALLPARCSDRSRFVCTMAHGLALVVAGNGEEGAAAIRAAFAILTDAPALRGDSELLSWTVVGALFLRDADTGAVIERSVNAGRDRAALSILTQLLCMAARHDATADRWPTASAAYHEALALSREAGYGSDVTGTLAGLAWLEARQGRETECRAHVAEARALADRLGMGIYTVWTHAALADLELALGRPDAALAHLSDQEGTLATLGIDDVDLSPVPEQVEALRRTGRDHEAAPLAERFVGAAAAKGQPWSRARAARCLGLLASDDDLDPHFQLAIELHRQTPDVFELARTQLLYGARLRRARRRLDSREQLRTALDTFERLGASTWSEHATAELAATGEHARRRDPSTLDDLTPQELQVAMLLTGGHTTRDAAAQLFLSPKTVEYHLRNTYRKLGINTRAKLAERLNRAN